MAFFREPTFNEVALKSGCMDSAAVRNGLVLGSWKRQSREEAEWIAEKAINLSGWLKAKEKDNLDPRLTALANKAIDEASIEVIKRAQDILRNNPELVPKANAKFFVWSDATKTKWRQVFGCAPPLPRSLAVLADGNRKALQENSKLLSDIVAKKRFRFGPLEKPKEKT
jgi:hypothetical protein